MILMIFSLLSSTMILLSGFVDFSTSSYALLSTDFKRSADVNAVNACLVYGDMEMRAKILPGAYTEKAPLKASLGCLASVYDKAKGKDVCSEELTCSSWVAAGKIGVSVSGGAPKSP